MLVLNYLQRTSPPILPSLQEMYFEQKTQRKVESIIIDGVDCSFYEDLESLQLFSSENSETLGALLYGFFHFYAYEFDYESSVISLRHGRLLTKQEKGWNVDVERLCRFLCVEEPFNPQRNLGNSADHVSVLGVRNEFRLATSVLFTTGDIDLLCTEYIFPQYYDSYSPKWSRSSATQTYKYRYRNGSNSPLPSSPHSPKQIETQLNSPNRSQEPRGPKPHANKSQRSIGIDSPNFDDPPSPDSTVEESLKKKERKQKKTVVWTNQPRRIATGNKSPAPVDSVSTMFEGLFQSGEGKQRKYRGSSAGNARVKQKPRSRSQSLPPGYFVADELTVVTKPPASVASSDSGEYSVKSYRDAVST